MAGIERRGQQLGSIRVDEPKSRAKSKAEAVVVEEAPAKAATTVSKKADTK